MKVLRILALMLICTYPLVLTSCWNYRELEELSIVAGVAIDKGVNGNYKLTAEIVEVTGGQEGQTKSKIVSMEGKTIFDAARNEISIAGKKLYWSHAKILIISEEIARDGILAIIDWFNRDAETREDLSIIISKGPAKEILEGHKVTESVKSFELDNIIKNQKSLSKARQVQLWEITNEISVPGLSATLPLVYLDKMYDTTLPQVSGTAVLKGDKLIGFLDGAKTKDFLFLKDQVKGGLLVEGKNEQIGTVPVSLEIFKSKTEIKPEISNNYIGINVDVETIVAVVEIGGLENVIETTGGEKLARQAEKDMKIRLENLVETVQTEFGKDIFGFGLLISKERPKLWKHISKDWDEMFRNLKVNINTTVHIRNSGMLSEPLEVGE